MLDILVIVGPFLVFLGLFIVIMFAGLSDASRYGIDEHGIAKTPTYLAEKKALEEWYEVFCRLEND